jgi:hypothetical protein
VASIIRQLSKESMGASGGGPSEGARSSFRIDRAVQHQPSACNGAEDPHPDAGSAGRAGAHRSNVHVHSAYITVEKL